MVSYSYLIWAKDSLHDKVKNALPTQKRKTHNRVAFEL
jgi:hypothetical protein